MKINTKAIICTVLGAAIFATTSCTDKFLEEVKRDSVSTDYLNEPAGLASMANSLYLEFNYFFSNESSYAYTNYGTDEFMVAGDASNGMWNDYDSRLGSIVQPRVNSNTQDITTFWNTLYQWNARANTIIAKADVLAGSDTKGTTLGTAYFVRGFNFLFLTMQFGDIPLVTKQIVGQEREFTRAPQEEVYKQIISDLEEAYKLLPADASLATKNYVSKYAAAHYLAKAHLWRASEINNGWNSAYIAEDLKAVINYADEVIAAHPLTPNYEDLYGNFDAYDTAITETNSEIVFASGSSDKDITLRKAHWGLALFTAWYQNNPHMKRDMAGAREYQRMKTTPSYAYFIYDLENDSRFWKSFKTTYAVNNASSKNTITTPAGEDLGIATEYFPSNNGDYLSTMYIINREEYGQRYYKSEVSVAKAATPSYTRTDYRTGKLIPAIQALNIYADGDKTGAPIGTTMTPDYNTPHAPLSKYLDGAVDKNNLGNGYRDGVLARSAEDYFFKAEALIRQGKTDAGLAVLQAIRDRAEYKAGEARDAYVDGGAAYHKNTYKSGLKGFEANCAFYPMNSYYYSLGGWENTPEGAAYREATNAKASVLPAVTKGNYPAEDMYVINKLGYTTEYDQAMCYLLNEKSREFYGEYLRWMDLARTKTLEKRLVFNNQAYAKELVDHLGNKADVNGITYATSGNGGSFRASQHYYRPIPQNFLDNITKDGKPLTTEEKQAMQNPGY